ncbi:MAG: hydrolase [Dehalococcoidales bacterium]
MTNHEGETGCCPRFDPEPWEEKETIWENKLFLKDTVPQFMHIPLPGTFGKAVTRAWDKIENAGAKPEDKDFLMLSAESSPWKGELYISITKEVPDAENVKLSGTYLTKVFDGPYNAVPSWVKEMVKYAEQKGKDIKNFYFYYATCPKCAKVYGHNYVVAFAEV